MHMKSKDYVIREYWDDGTETTYISREKSEQWALEHAEERYKNIKHVIGLNGPNRFELVGVNNADDSKRYWHPAISISSLIERVYMLDELKEHTMDKVIKATTYGEVGIDTEASPGNGPYYVKMYDGTYDTVGFDTLEEAWAELEYVACGTEDAELEDEL